MSSTNIASPATSSRAQNLNWLTWHLTKARFRSHPVSYTHLTLPTTPYV